LPLSPAAAIPAVAVHISSCGPSAHNGAQQPDGAPAPRRSQADPSARRRPHRSDLWMDGPHRRPGAAPSAFTVDSSAAQRVLNVLASWAATTWTRSCPPRPGGRAPSILTAQPAGEARLASRRRGSRSPVANSSASTAGFLGT